MCLAIIRSVGPRAHDMSGSEKQSLLDRRMVIPVARTRFWITLGKTPRFGSVATARANLIQYKIYTRCLA